MRVVVVGAGITGLLSAWYLRQEGHEVTVVEQAAGPGQGASYANGAQLSYSYVAPLAGPGVLPKVPPWLFRRDSPLRLRPALDWRQWWWLAQFVMACGSRQSETTTRRLLRLAFYSRELMNAFIQSPGGRSIEFCHKTNGKLVVYSDAQSLSTARRLVEFQRSLGCVQTVLGPDACMVTEPALAAPASELGRRLAGGVFTPSEEVGDCFAFCEGLERLLHAQGVSFVYGFKVQRLKRARPGRAAGQAIQSACGPAGELPADCFVLASGIASARLASQVGLYLPIYPLKGYSVTLPAGARAPRISVTDFSKKMVYAPLTTDAGPARPGRRVLRVAGLADLAGHEPRIDPRRLSVLMRDARAAFPQCVGEACGGVPTDLQPWAGLRPATPSGAPLLGPTAIANLFLNTGHGALGWTLAHGSAKAVSDLLTGREPEISMEGFAG